LFLEKCLGFSQAEIDLANKMIGAGISEEQKRLMEEILDITTPVPTGAAGGGLELPSKNKPVVKKKPVTK
jgi:hypothetical protein